MTDKWKLNKVMLLHCVCVNLIVGLLFFYIGTTMSNKRLSKSEYIKQQQQAKAAPAPLKLALGDPEIAPTGYIRSINYEGRSFLYESESGFVKVFAPVCGGGMLPVWPGMHVNQINYRWAVNLQSTSGGCYALDFVAHAAKGDYPVK